MSATIICNDKDLQHLAEAFPENICIWYNYPLMDDNILGKELLQLGITKERITKNKKRHHYYIGIITRQETEGQERNPNPSLEQTMTFIHIFPFFILILPCLNNSCQNKIEGHLFASNCHS